MSRYTIIGQGVAGSLVAWALEKRGIGFTIIDDGNTSAASRLSTGVLNPVTGRRLALAWKAEVMMHKAWETYSDIENALGTTFTHRCSILKLFGEVREENDWLGRVSLDHPFLRDVGEVPDDSFHAARGVRIEGGGWINQGRMLEALRSRWKKQGVLREDTLDAAFEPLDRTVIVYCDGVGILSRTHFYPLRLVPSKGEYLTLRAPGVPAHRIVGSKYVLVPRGEDAFSFGSTYDRDDLSHEPTREARRDLEARLHRLLRVPFEITGHYVGIRPSTYDRRPLLGRHPKDTHRVLFNGLGSKGALMGPWLAEHLVAHLEDDAPLDPECWWLR